MWALAALIVVWFGILILLRISGNWSGLSSLIKSAITSKHFTKLVAWDTVILSTTYDKKLNNVWTNISMKVQYFMDRSKPEHQASITYNVESIIITARGFTVTGVSYNMCINFEQEEFKFYMSIPMTAHALNFITLEEDVVFTELIAKLSNIVLKKGNARDQKRIELLKNNFGDYTNGGGIIDQLKWIANSKKVSTI